MLSDYVLAKSLDEALEALRGGNARVVAGGTDLWLDLKSGKVSVDTLVSISGISELKEISMCDGRIRIGAAVTHGEVASSPVIRRSAPLLAQACGSVGSVQIRNIGTVVGNVINAQPAADAAVALVALGAVAEIRDENGVSYTPVEKLYAGLGKSKVDSSRQMVTAVTFSALRENQGSAFVRLAQRKAMALPVLNVAVVVTLATNKIEEIRIVCAPVGPQPMRAYTAERVLAGAEPLEEKILEAARLAAEEADPRDSAVRGSRAYRKAVLPALVRRAVSEAVAAAVASS